MHTAVIELELIIMYTLLHPAFVISYDSQSQPFFLYALHRLTTTSLLTAASARFTVLTLPFRATLAFRREQVTVPTLSCRGHPVAESLLSFVISVFIWLVLYRRNHYHHGSSSSWYRGWISHDGSSVGRCESRGGCGPLGNRMRTRMSRDTQ
jgi:hypothetical protein